MPTLAILALIAELGALGASGALGAPVALGASGAFGATGASGAGVCCEQVAPGAQGAESMRVDIGVGVLVEAWDLNGEHETLFGINAGLDRAVWRGVAVRGELLGLRVVQQRGDAWLGGFTLGTRMRWGRYERRPFVDVAVGLAQASAPVPPPGTRFNYLALIGAGIERPVGPLILTVTGRWLHASNNGREGRHLNPDIQSLGALVSVGWEH